MSAPLIALCGLAYLWVCIEQITRGNFPTAIVFGGYAFSNIGLVWLALR